MAIKFLIWEKNNGKSYKVLQGATITRNLNETLDSVELSLEATEEEIDIEPLDECIIYTNEKINGFDRIEDSNYNFIGYGFYMCVDRYTRKQISLDPAIYQYDISLFSQTKLLEGIVLPSLKITKGSVFRNIYNYLSIYLNDYGLKKRVNVDLTTDEFEVKPRWEYSYEVVRKFGNIECPEMQWNEPTLRQVITDLMMVGDCIPVLKNGVIDLIDLTKKKEEITTQHLNKKLINYIQQSQSSDDYISELKMNVKNAISDTDRLVTVSEYIGCRNSDVGVLTDQNIRLETQYPIYDIKSLIVSTYGKGFFQDKQANKKTLYFFVDEDLVKDGICVEKGVRDVRPLWARGWFEDFKNELSEMAKFQNTSLYYTRGDNKIYGLAEKSDFYTVSEEKPVYYLLINSLPKKISKLQYQDKEWTKEANTTNMPVFISWERLVFQIEYQTTQDAVFKASKQDSARNERVVVDNQTNSYVDTDTQGMLEYLKANRLGNKMLLMNGRYERVLGHYNYVGTLGMTYASHIIFREQISLFDDYIVANYYATKNYILRDYFTGVQAKQRSWKLLAGKDALVRHDLLKRYYELSFKKATNIKDQQYNQLLRPLLSAFASKDRWNELILDNYYNVKCAVQFKDIQGVLYPDDNNGSAYHVDLATRIIGNSLVFTFALQDNIYVGKYIKGLTTGGLAQEPLRYADNNGENVGGYLYLNNFIPIADRYGTIESFKKVTEGIYDAKNSRLFDASNIKPYVDGTQFTSTFVQIPFFFNKDNGEIEQISLQLEFCVREGDDIRIGKKFIENQILSGSKIALENKTKGIKVYYSEETTYDRVRLDELPADAVLNEKASVDIDFDPVEQEVIGIKLKNCDKGNYTYITNYLNDILLVFSTKSLNTYTIYVNSLFMRDDRVYIDNQVKSIYDI